MNTRMDYIFFSFFFFFSAPMYGMRCYRMHKLSNPKLEDNSMKNKRICSRVGNILCARKVRFDRTVCGHRSRSRSSTSSVKLCRGPWQNTSSWQDCGKSLNRHFGIFSGGDTNSPAHPRVCLHLSLIFSYWLSMLELCTALTPRGVCTLIFCWLIDFHAWLAHEFTRAHTRTHILRIWNVHHWSYCT